MFPGKKKIFWAIITYGFKIMVESKGVLLNYGWTSFLITAKPGCSGTARLCLGHVQ